jgi:hypothetical protein
MRSIIEIRAFLGARRMNISASHRCIFFHIPKTAGSSIGELGFLEYKGHFPRAKWAKFWMSSRRWSQYFKFCFVRNPWDRFVSLYSYYKNMGPDHRWHVGRNVEIAHAVKQLPDFSAFCRAFPTATWRDHFMFDPQWTWVGTRPQSLLVDYVGRFERIDADFEHICNRLGLPPMTLGHHNKSKHKHYHDYYTQETIDLVGEYYRDDVNTFFYEF